MDEETRNKSRKVVSVHQVQRLTILARKRKQLFNDIAVALLLSGSIGALILSKNVAAKFDIFMSMEETFVAPQFKVEGTAEYFMGLEGIKLEDQIWQYLDDVLYPQLFQENNEDVKVPGVQSNYALWGVRFRTQSQTELGANKYSDVQNVMEAFYGSDMKRDIVSGLDSGYDPISDSYGPEISGVYTDKDNNEATYVQNKYTYWTAAQTRAVETTGVTQNTYDGGGYVVDIPYGDSSQAWSDINDDLRQNLLNKHSRALFVHTFFYNPDYNEFVIMKILFELLPTGSVQPQTFVLSCEIYGNDTPGYYMFTMGNYLCAAIVLWSAMRAIGLMTSMVTSPAFFEKSLFLWYSFDCFLALMFLYVRAFIIIEFWNTETSQLPISMTTDVIYDYEHLCAAKERGYVIDQIVFLLFSFRILKFVGFSRPLQLLLGSLWKSKVEVGSFLGFVVALISVFSIFAWVSFGTYYADLEHLQNSYLYHTVLLFSGRMGIPNSWNPFRVRHIQGHMIAFYICAFVIRAMWVAIVIHAWHESARHWREENHEGDSFVKCKRACSLRSCQSCVSNTRKRCCFCFETKRPFIVPSEQDMVVAFTRWLEKSSALGRFPYIGQDLLAAYLRDDEKLEHLLLPKSDDELRPTDFGMTDEEWNRITTKQRKKHILDAKLEWKQERSKIIAGILFNKWQGIWTPQDYALGKYEEERALQEQKSQGSLQSTSDPVQLAIATNSLIELEKDFLHHTSQIWSILDDVEKRQESLSQATMLLTKSLKEHIAGSDQDEFVADLSLEEEEKIATSTKEKEGKKEDKDKDA